MARDHARIRLDIWADEDWRDLPSLPQWLYLHLLSSPSLSFCGVTAWRPARIAALALGLQASDVEYAASWLEDGRFILADRETEEVLVRSFIKHDGLVKSPNMSKALVKSHAAVGSKVLRAVIIDQLKRLKAAQPDLSGWQHLGTLLAKDSLTVAKAFPKLSPNPSANPSAKGSGNPSESRPELRSPLSSLHAPSSSHHPDSRSNGDRGATSASDGMMQGAIR